MKETYIFTWRKHWGWNKVLVTDHSYDTKSNKMILFMHKGGVREIAHWSDCEMQLGIDWETVQITSMVNKAKRDSIVA